jgi:hypothetical protein
MLPDDDHLHILQRLDRIEEYLTLLVNPWWVRWWWRINGWPADPVQPYEQAWRFWHRWGGRRDGRVAR